jgi:hypothetical protein
MAASTGATAENTYMAAITSRKVNGNWLRSNAQFDVVDAVPTFAQAISTYPVGQERFLNGSDVDVAVSAANTGSGGESTGGSTSEGGTTNNDQGNDGPPPEGGGFGG